MNRSLLVLLALTAVPPFARAASFDCARAAAPDERAVCADPRLSQLDDMLGRAYAQAKASSGKDDAVQLAIVARGILADRRACGTAQGCLAAVYLGGIESYTRFGSTIPTVGPPYRRHGFAEIGHSEIHTFMERPPSQGEL